MRTRVCCAALLLAVSSALLGSSTARADEKDAVTEMARRRFQEGVKFFDQKRFEEARGAFLQAYALKRHPALLLNLAQSEIRSGHPAEAARHFVGYLREPQSASPLERSEAEKGLREARTKLARVQISAPAGADVFLDGESVGPAPIADPVDVMPGTHNVEARLGGKSATAIVSVLVSRLAAVTVAFESAPAPQPPPSPTPAAEPPPSAATPAPSPTGPELAPASEPPRESEPTRPKEESAAGPTSDEGRENFLAWIGHNELAIAGVGVAGAGVGVFIGFGLAAQRADENVASVAADIRQETANQKLTRTAVCATPIQAGFGQPCGVLANNVDTRDLDRTLATIGLVATGVSFAAVATAYFIAPGKSTARQGRAKIAPIAGPHQAGLAVIGTF